MAPAFIWHHRRLALITGGLATLGQVLFGYAAPTTLTSVQRFFPNPDIMRSLEQMAGYALLAIGGAFVGAIVGALWRSRDRMLWGGAGAVLGLCVATGAVTRQFSSRYPAMALPLLLLVLAPWIKPGPWLISRLLCGSLLGLAVLHSYCCYA